MAKQNKEKLKPRPPIVVVMGHVDHGKTTLLDYIRKANVASREAGGITQAVGAYEIDHNGRKITFIDTPGHEAFTKMRSRGAEIADLAILVVAADEGVKPQTKEAIKILNDTKTQFVVAITKIDKPGADVDKVKNELTATGVLLEGYGGQVSYHGLSSKTGEGVDDLLDLILLAADLEGLTYDPDVPAAGFVLETRRDRRRGDEAAVIIKDGTLKRGDEIYAKTAKGKVKILEDFLGKTVSALEPSAPALIIGFEILPKIGEVFLVGSKPEVVSGEADNTVSDEKLAPKSDDKALNLILKASDAGCLEALSSVIRALGTEERAVCIVNESVGDITDGDIKNAIATGSVVVGFKNRVDKAAGNFADSHEVEVITSGVIYDLVKAVEKFLIETGKPKSLGEMEILAVFNQKKLNEQLVGGRVLSGVLRSKANFEIWRGLASAPDDSGEGGEVIPAARGMKEEKVGMGKVLSLRDKKTDINEAKEGSEVGVFANSHTKIEVGDKLVVHK